MLLEDTITKPAYDEKYDEFTNKITKLVDEKEVLLENVKEQKNIGKRMSELRLALQKEDVLDEFDRTVFESIVEKVIVGSEDEESNVDFEDPNKNDLVGWMQDNLFEKLIK